MPPTINVWRRFLHLKNPSEECEEPPSELIGRGNQGQGFQGENMMAKARMLATS